MGSAAGAYRYWFVNNATFTGSGSVALTACFSQWNVTTSSGGGGGTTTITGPLGNQTPAASVAVTANGQGVQTAANSTSVVPASNSGGFPIGVTGSGADSIANTNQTFPLASPGGLAVWLYAYNGSSWSRVRDSAIGQNVQGNGLLAASGYCMFNNSPTTITTGNYSNVQCDSSGNTLVKINAGQTGTSALQTQGATGVGTVNGGSNPNPILSGQGLTYSITATGQANSAWIAVQGYNVVTANISVGGSNTLVPEIAFDYNFSGVAATASSAPFNWTVAANNFRYDILNNAGGQSSDNTANITTSGIYRFYLPLGTTGFRLRPTAVTGTTAILLTTALQPVNMVMGSNGQSVPQGSSGANSTNININTLASTGGQVPGGTGASNNGSPRVVIGSDQMANVTLANMPTATTLTARNEAGAIFTEKGSRFSVISNPAAGSQATASIAAESAVRHVADCIAFSAASTSAPVATALTVNLRDGATGAGTIIWTYQTVVLAATGQNISPFSVCGLNLPGTTNTAMTLEWSASLANLIQSVSVSGYNVN